MTEPHLLIRSTAAGGHRRCGMRFGSESIAIPESSLEDETRAALEADPRLVIEIGEGPFEGDADAPPNLEGMTVAQLRQFASTRAIDLPQGGRKAELITKIQEAITAGEELSGEQQGAAGEATSSEKTGAASEETASKQPATAGEGSSST